MDSQDNLRNQLLESASGLEKTHCFILKPDQRVEDLLESSGVCMGKQCRDCVLTH